MQSRTHALVASLILTVSLASAAAAPVDAQLRQICLALNEHGYGEEYCTVPVLTGLQGNAAYTIEAWVRPTSYGVFPAIVGNDFTVSYWLGLSSSGNVRFYPRGGASGYVETAAVVPLDTWTHVAATYDAVTGFAIYIDGVRHLSGNSITGPVGVNTSDLRIGADRTVSGPAYFWHGYLDEIRIWSRVRTESEIRATQFAGVGVPSYFTSGVYAGLEANWVVEGTGITAFGDPSFATPAEINLAYFVNGNKDSHTTYYTPFGAPVAPNVGLKLNGLDDRVVLPVSEDFGEGVTILAWIAPTSLTNFQTIVSRDYVSSFWLGLTPAGRLRFYPAGGGYVDGNAVVPTNRWTHVAATYGHGRTTLYVNGEVDLVSTTFTADVGANGRDVWIGANPSTFGANYPFAGYLDEVRIAQGPLDRLTIRNEMYRGVIDNAEISGRYDEWYELVGYYHVDFDWSERYTVLGSGASLVRSGAPTVSTDAAQEREVEHFENLVVGGFSLPNDDFAGIVTIPILWPSVMPVTGVEVFVSAAVTDLAATHVRLQSPAGTWVDLIEPGTVSGRDLLTVFHDGADHTLATGAAPYHDGVRPADVLATLNGQPAQGIWNLQLSAAGGARVGLWAWGIELNGIPLAVDDAAAPGPRLRLEGANPVRGSGHLAFELAEAANVDLALFDVQGRKVRSLLSGTHGSGAVRVVFDAADLAAGLYLARLELDGERSASARVLVVR